MKKKAVVVGINYEGTANELRGCINDANNVERLLVDVYQFDQVVKLLEGEATTDGIKTALYDMVTDAAPGDVLFFHYSGHGSQVYDASGDETDRFDEIICPIDINWRDKIIKDDDLKSIFNLVPMGANLTVFLDCCNSGTGLDQTEAFQPYGPGDQRSLEQITMRYMPPPQEIAEQFQSELLLPKTKSLASRDVDQSSVLITGCQSYQTSADANINGQWQGAATYALTTALKANASLTYKQLVIQMNEFMIKEGYTQRPELNGLSGLYSETFLASFAPEVVELKPDPVTTDPEQILNTPAPEKESSTTKTLLVGLAVALLLLILFG